MIEQNVHPFQQHRILLDRTVICLLVDAAPLHRSREHICANAQFPIAAALYRFYIDVVLVNGNRLLRTTRNT